MIDVLLLVVIVGYTVVGYRQGLLVSALSFVGFLGGGALAMWLLPHVLGDWLGDATTLRSSLVLVGGVLVAASIGQALAGALRRPAAQPRAPRRRPRPSTRRWAPSRAWSRSAS